MVFKKYIPGSLMPEIKNINSKCVAPTSDCVLIVFRFLQVLVFFAETLLCLNWSLVTDMLLVSAVIFHVLLKVSLLCVSVLVLKI